MPEVLYGPAPHKQAVRFIKDKPAVTRAVYDQMLPEVQARAFTVAGIESTKVLQRLRDRIADLPAGADWGEVKRDVVAGLSPFMPPADDTPEAKAKALEIANRRAELLLRTHGFQAYAASQHEVMARQRDVFPFWRYQTAQDDRVRDTHAALDGVILPANDPFWDTHFPPWGFNCRCSIVPLTEADAAEIDAAESGRPPEMRSRLSEQQRQRLHTDGTLVRGPNKVINVSPAREPGGYTWTPGSLKLPLAEIEQRYEPEVFGAFRSWAKRQKLPGGSRTVWTWLGGSADDLWPDRLADLSLVKKLGGSTGAQLMRDPEKRLFVLKRGAGPAHVASEVAADDAYRVLGANVPRAKLYTAGGETAKLAEFIEGQELGKVLPGLPAAEQAAVLAQVRRHFVADALLGNYDVAGLDLDNLLVDQAGLVWRIDNGGSLRFRAQGALKSAFGPEVVELKTLLDPKVNPATARIFAGITDSEINHQIVEILAKREALLAAVPAEVRDLLGQRLDNLAGRLAPAGGEAFAQAVAKSRVVGKAAKWDRLDIEDTQVLFWGETGADGVAVTRAKLKLTEAGSAKIMARLRASLPAPTSAPADDFWPVIVSAAKTINKHAQDGAYNAATLANLAATKKKLLALQPAGENAAGMKAHYLGIIARLEAAQAARETTPLFQSWVFKPEPAAGAHEFAVARTRVDYLAKDTRRGHAREMKQTIYTHEALLLDLGEGTRVRFVPFAEIDGATEFAAPYALRGYLEVVQSGAPSAGGIGQIARKLADIGLDTSAATDAYAELLYLRKGMQIRSDVFTPAKRRAADSILADPKLSDPEKITKLKAMVKKTMGLDLPDTPQPGYDWRAKGNTFGEGWEHTERWDLPRAEIERAMPGWTLGHSSSTPLPDLVDSILEGGGDFTATTERLRKGLAISAGMSPMQDLNTGGANYLFTRIFRPERAAQVRGVHFKVGNLARQDAFSFDKDRYGNVRTAAAYTERKTTLDALQAAAARGGNETIFKWGIPLLDELDFIDAGSAAERKKIIAVFKQHGWSALPDGRKIETIVKLKGT